MKEIDNHDDFENRDLARLVKENNRMLKSMNRREKTRSFFSFLKWGLIIVFFVFGYMQVKPYLESMMALYEKVGEQSESLSGITDKVGEFDLEKLTNIFGQ